MERLWVLDTPAERLVIDATYLPGVTDREVEQLTAIVESLRFQPAAG